SRTTFDWGIPVPGDEKHVMYVWVDALTNYISALGYPDTTDGKWGYWPADAHIIGKDISRFHAVYWPAFLMSAGIPLPKRVFAHGFLFNRGEKMSKSLGNTVTPQDVIKESGADILRLWVMTTDYWEDQRLGKSIIQTNIDAYRKLRNTIRWMLGTLAHDEGENVAHAELPELERLMLHRLTELDEIVRSGYDAFDFKRIARTL
ncbi:class I tRNA ligase family protein, partial [Staphylococcus aureus]|uniref:class I tRNA ligase family protein n=1 Tax=Staphylococcus aureus TaxID=1280 RepID=UPI00115507AE